MNGLDIMGILNVVEGLISGITIIMSIIKLICKMCKTSNDFGIITPISKIINLLKESVIWVIILLFESMILSEIIPIYILENPHWIKLFICLYLMALIVIECIIWLRELGVKIEANNLYIICVMIILLQSIFMACCWHRKIYTSEQIKYKFFEYLIVIITFAVVLEFILVAYGRKKRHTFYYKKGAKCYIHKITDREIICSYNRKLNERKGYTIEKIDDIMKKPLFCEYEDTAYSYLQDVLIQNKIDAINYKEIINCTANGIAEKLNIKFVDKDKKLPQSYWGVAYLIVTSKIKWLQKKLDELKSGQDNSSLLLKTEDKNVYVLLLYKQKKIPWRKIYTDGLDRFIESVAAELEYNPQRKV